MSSGMFSLNLRRSVDHTTIQQMPVGKSLPEAGPNLSWKQHLSTIRVHTVGWDRTMDHGSVQRGALWKKRQTWITAWLSASTHGLIIFMGLLKF